VICLFLELKLENEFLPDNCTGDDEGEDDPDELKRGDYYEPIVYCLDDGDYGIDLFGDI